MIGNVWEWTQDCWNANYNGAPADGSAWMGGDCSRRVLRGGSWFDFRQHLRSAYRSGLATGYRSSFLGFRVAMSLETPTNRVMRFEEGNKRKDEANQSLEQKKEFEQRRLEQMKRLKGLPQSFSTDPTDKETTIESFPLGTNYLSRLRARVKPNITFPYAQLQYVKGNPEAEVEVVCNPSGEILSKKLIRSSSNSAWDEAVMNAIEKTGTLPRDENGNMPPIISFSFRPKD